MSQAQSILIVDDEPNLRQSLALILQSRGYQVTVAGNAAEAMQCVEAGGFHLAFLDIKMPDTDGITLLSQIREKYPELPVFILTAHATLETAMKAVRYGANDYLLKPIEPQLILDRVNEALQDQRRPQRRREVTTQIHELINELRKMEDTAVATPENPAPAPAKDTRYLKRGAITVDMQTHRVTLDGKEYLLPPSTFNFLVSLVRHSPDPVSYDVLVSEAQGYNLTRSEAREMARCQIHELRKVLEPDLRHPAHIITERNIGYRLVA